MKNLQRFKVDGREFGVCDNGSYFELHDLLEVDPPKEIFPFFPGGRDEDHYRDILEELLARYSEACGLIRKRKVNEALDKALIKRCADELHNRIGWEEDTKSWLEELLDLSAGETVAGTRNDTAELIEAEFLKQNAIRGIIGIKPLQVQWLEKCLEVHELRHGRR
jgi:hypothetical protein